MLKIWVLQAAISWWKGPSSGICEPAHATHSLGVSPHAYTTTSYYQAQILLLCDTLQPAASSKCSSTEANAKGSGPVQIGVVQPKQHRGMAGARALDTTKSRLPFCKPTILSVRFGRSTTCIVGIEGQCIAELAWASICTETHTESLSSSQEGKRSPKRTRP